MNYKEEILKRLAPCGLDCGRCADFAGGEIKQLSARLVKLLGGYRRVAKMKEGMRPVFTGYPQFEEILTSISEASCSGCRGDNVLCFIVCIAKDCTREKGIDFCFQCGEFPCDRQFEGRLRERWIALNNRMKEIGVVEFYEEQKRLPRY